MNEAAKELLRKYEARLGLDLTAIDDKIRMYQDAITKLSAERETVAAEWEIAVEALGE